MKVKVIPKFCGEFLDSVNSNFGWIIKVINNDGFETTEQKLKNGVATDVTGSTGNENSFVKHGRTVLSLEWNVISVREKTRGV